MKNIWIVGGATGIGKALTELLSKQDCRIFATYHNSEPEFQSSSVSYHQIDVLQEEWDLSFLPDALHGLVYCPGAVNLKPFKRIKPQDFIEDYKLQVLGAIRAVQAAIPLMNKAEHASVVFFSTVAVQQGFNFHSLVSSSKGAIEGLSRALAAELAPKVRINCIAPSLTDTPLTQSLLNSDAKKENNAQRHPLKSIGQPSDIAHMADYLLSEKSKWITGQVLHVDGGISSLRI